MQSLVPKTTLETLASQSVAVALVQLLALETSLGLLAAPTSQTTENRRAEIRWLIAAVAACRCGFSFVQWAGGVEGRGYNLYLCHGHELLQRSSSAGVGRGERQSHVYATPPPGELTDAIHY